MNHFVVTRGPGGGWYIGGPDVWHAAAGGGLTEAEALAAVLARLGISREDLSFEPADLRAEFDAQFDT